MGGKVLEDHHGSETFFQPLNFSGSDVSLQHLLSLFCGPEKEGEKDHNGPKMTLLGHIS